jgi:hypothetical protein
MPVRSSLAHLRGRPLLTALCAVGIPLAIVAALATAQSGGDPIAHLENANLAQFSNADLELYIATYRAREPDLRQRLVNYAEKSLGQRFELPAPMYALDHCDCVTFVERVYALALAWDHDSFRGLVSRLRHRDGEEGYLNRNHFTIGEWVPNNTWLFEDLTKELGHGEIKPWIPLHHIIRRTEFFAQQGVEVDIPDEKVVDAFIPREALPDILDQLQTGDVALLIRGELADQYCQHWAIVIVDAEDPSAPLAKQVMIAYGGRPWSQMVPLMEFLGAHDYMQGCKFLRPWPNAEQLAAQELQP